MVLDPNPQKHKRFRDDVLQAIAIRETGGAEDQVAEAVRRAGLLGATPAEMRAARLVPDAELDAALGALLAAGKAVRYGEVFYDALRVADAARDVQRLAAEYQKANPLAWGIGRAELQERLGHKGAKARFAELLDGIARLSQDAAGVAEAANSAVFLRPDAARVGSPDRQLSAADQALLEKFEILLRDGGLAPPTPNEIQTQLNAGPRFPAFVGLMEERGALVKVNDALYYHPAALGEIESKLRSYFAGHDLMSMGDFKDLTDLSRKFAVPLLEWFDRRGFTQRLGDNRKAGPHLGA